VRKIVEKKKSYTDPAYQALLDRLRQSPPSGPGTLRARGLHGSAKSFYLSLLFSHTSRSMVVVSPTERESRDMARDMSFFLGPDRVLHYPSWDALSTDLFAFERETEMARLEGLCRLLLPAPSVIALSLKALAQKVMPRTVLEGYRRVIAIGDTQDRDALAETLLAGGYRRETLVEERGEFSVRGHVLDLFPPTAENPYRLEFFGDELESIRTFDPATQRSLGEEVEFVLTPAREVILSERRRQRAVQNIRMRADKLDLPRTTRERLAELIGNDLVSATNPLFLSLFYENGGSSDSPSGLSAGCEDNGESLAGFLDYPPAGSLIVVDDPLAMGPALETLENDMDRFLMKARDENRFYLEREAACLNAGQIEAQLQAFQRVVLVGLAMDFDGSPDEAKTADPPVRFEVVNDFGLRQPQPAGMEEAGLFRPLAEKIEKWLQEGYLLTFVCSGSEEVQRMSHLAAQYRLPVHRPEGSILDEVEHHAGQGRLILREGRIGGSFRVPAFRVTVISEADIFGRKVARKKWRPVREGYFLKSFGELKEGDFVVHTDHGIGLYRGLQKLAIDRIENDFLLLEYLDGDKLYIPVDRLDQIQRYIGPDGHAPKIDKLGGPSWDAVKEKVRKSVREVAEELVGIYAAREVMERDAFAPPDRMYDEFSASFEFEETPDQARAIEDIHLDMNDARPMDRLICGDAGFGKTEVALRASFRSVMGGRQVAVLVPTTILAEQHYQTFSRRLREYPVRVEVLNRFRTRAEQHVILEGLRKGVVDIVIGTHRLLQKDVDFKDLGLVIVDEEQRFGVAHKEKLKKLRTLVDVLTLTATPIPRTLHLSLVGIRDLSIINTPPEDRRPIKTYVLEFNEEVIREAVRAELGRGGQVFFLHDRVRSIFTMTRFLEKLVPEARIGVVHGQMKPREIEEAMKKFVRGDVDVLVCTSIIGSGLDIPTANTIIINRADRFGLAQLYQIRGRVGRAREEAAAYLLMPKGAMLSRDARKRLRVIVDFSEPGSGFRIASSDLDIRGGGSLLGTSQSGHVSAVGYELYTELMEKTIRELKGEPMPEEEVRPEINLGLPAFIPADYMPDERQRLVSYKRISLAAADEDIAALRGELTDLYGYVPAEVDNLFEVIRIKNLLKPLKGKKISYDGQNLMVAFHEKSPVDPAKLIELARKKIRGMRLTPDYRLFLPMPGLSGDEVVGQAKKLLQTLCPQCENKTA
jgi:transcription-repair coupling factor (superfamily II helicase)